MKRIPYFLLLAFLAIAVGTGDVRSESEILPEELRLQLNLPLDKRVESLLEKKTGDGFQYHQGIYGPGYRKVDDDTYRVTFTERIATATRMKVDRYELTLKRTGPRKWEIAGEELRHSHDGLWRDYAVADFREFDSLDFDREGLKVTSGPGQLFFNVYNGEISGLVAVADGMRYEYEVPGDVPVGYYKQVQAKIRDRFHNQLDFKPSWLEIDCDPHSCRELVDTIFTGLSDKSAPAVPDDPPWVPAGSSSGADGKLYDRFQKFGKRNSKSYKERLDDNAFTGFRVPWKEDRRRILVAAYNGNEDNGIYMRIDNWQPEEVMFGVFFETVYNGPVFNYNSEKTRKAGLDPYEVESRPDLGSRDWEIEKLSVRVDAALEDPEVLTGRVSYKINTLQDVTELQYALPTATRDRESEERRNPSLRIFYVEVDGREVTVIPTSPFQGVVLLPEEVPAGSSIDLYVEYQNRCIRKYSQSYSYLPRGGWMPFVRVVDKIDEFEMTVRTPSRYKALGVGYLVESSTESGVTTTHWEADSPVSFPTIIFGEYFEGKPNEEIRVVKNDGTEVPVTVHVDLENKTSWDIRGKQLEPIANQAASALDLYREVSGVDYPYRALNLVNDAGSFAGQAPASIVYLGGGVFRGEGLVGSIGGSNLSMFNKSVVAHEVAHQWWGGVVGNSNRRNYWFVESLAEFFSALWVEQMYGKEDYQKKVEEWRRNILEAELMASIQRSDIDYRGEFGRQARQALVYDKGAFVFHILRQTFGDEKFFPFLKEFCKDLAEKREVVTLDIQRAAEKYLGGVDEQGRPYHVDLEWFFNQWIRGIGTPEYRFTYSTRRNEDGRWIIEGTIEQQVMYGNNQNKKVMEGVYYRGIVPITVVAKKDREYKQRLVVEGKETPFRLLVPERPQRVFLNRDRDILAFDIEEREL